MITIDGYSSSNTMRERTIIEDYCLYAESFLPSAEKLLFLMYYRHGYSTIEIGKLLGLHNGTISRRLGKIGNKLTEIIKTKKTMILEGRIGREQRTLALI